MPSESLQGWNEDGSANDDYCKYCYMNGEFANKDITMEEMLDRCCEISESVGIPEEKMRQYCEKLLPTLKRWSKK